MSIDPPETTYVETSTVKCAGNDNNGANIQGAALGHPVVYLNLGPEGRTECPYCDREFLLKKAD